MGLNWGKTLSIFILAAFLFSTFSPGILLAAEESVSKEKIVTTEPVSTPAIEEKSIQKESTGKAKITPIPTDAGTEKTTDSNLMTAAATSSTSTESPGPGEIKSPDSPLNSNAAYQTGLFTGSANYDYSIPVPPGTNGLTPEVKLSYNSMGASGRSAVVGVGWNLGLSYIYRDPKYTVADTADDMYKLVLNGSNNDLIYDPIGQLYKTKVQSDLWIKQYSTGGGNQLGGYWVVRTKDGSEYRFGNSSDSEAVCLNRNYTSRWHLKSLTDVSGNNIYFSYLENLNTGDTGTTYLEKIEYNNEKSRRIEFVYEDKPDAVFGYELGCTSRESKRLKEIKTVVNNTTNKKHTFTYIQDFAGRSLLDRITETDNNNNTLPSTKFSYHGNEAPSWSTTGVKWFSATNLFVTYRDDGTVYSPATSTFADVDRDGLTDLVYLDGIHKNRGTYWESQTITNNANIKYPDFIVSPNSKPVFFAEFDLDGFPDFVEKSNETYYIKLNRNNQWLSKTWFGLSTSTSSNDNAFNDFNSDGKSDLFISYGYASNISNRRYCKLEINNGQNWEPNVTHNYVTWYSLTGGRCPGASNQMYDVNSDGFVDMTRGAAIVNNEVYLSTGASFESNPRSYYLQPGSTYPDFNGNFSVLDDINGDGFQDFVETKNKTQRYAYMGKGETYSPVAVLLNGGGGEMNQNTAVVNGSVVLKRDRHPGILADVNGDGMSDIVYSLGYGTDNNDQKATWVYYNLTKPSGLLNKITTSLGGTTEIEYTPSTKYDNTGGDGISDLGFPVWTVSKITENDGMGNSDGTTFAYKNGMHDYQDREFRGFGQVTTTNSEGTVTEHYFHQDDALKGNEYKTIIKDQTGKPYQENRNTWNSIQTGAVYTNRLVTTDTFTYDGITTNPKQTRITYEYDSYGNVTLEKNWGDFAVTGDELTTSTSFVYNTTKWIVDKPKNIKLLDSSNNKIKESWIFYDASTDNNAVPQKGLVTREEQWNNNGSNIITGYEYNLSGNVTRQVDSLNRTTVFGYDPTNTFQTTITNSKNHILTTTYDPATGNKLTETDPNGYVKTSVYDGFGRIVKEVLPYDSAIYPTTMYEYTLTGNAPAVVKVMKRENTAQAGTIDAYTILDGFGRVIQTRTEAEDVTKQIATGFSYNGFGKVEKQILPQLVNTAIGYAVLPSGSKAVNLAFDPLGRVVGITNPDNTKQAFKYDHWKLTLSDANNHRRVQYLNAYNQITQIDENKSGVVYTTRYEYQFPGGNVTKITDSKGSQIRFEYDSLGRNTKLIDHSIGTWVYTYDAVGNMLSQTDNRGVTVNTAYDVLNRPVLINYPTDTDIQFVYDREKIGTISEISDATGTTKYSYDNRLRTIKEEKAIVIAQNITNGSPSINKTFITENTYDSADRIVAIKYPVIAGQTQPETLNYSFNTQGQIETVGGILANINYNALNKIVRKEYANSVNTNYVYNQMTERLEEINTAKSGAVALQNFKYTYDNVGNITTISDLIKATTQRFAYDDLDRLIKAEEQDVAGVSNYKHQYEYDSVGNILSVSTQDGAVDYYYEDLQRPNVLTRITAVTDTAECEYFVAKYYANKELSGAPVYSACEKNIDNDWGWGELNSYVSSNNASVSWEGFFNFDAVEYTFQTTADDGVRLYIDNVTVINEWRSQGANNYTYKQVMTAGEHNIRLEYFEDGGPAVMKAFWEKSAAIEAGNTNPSHYCSGIGQDTYCAEYYPNVYLGGIPELVREEDGINYLWNTNAPAGFAKSDNYSVRWSGNFEMVSGDYAFSATADDGVRVWVDGSVIVNEWKNQGSTTYTKNVVLDEGVHNIVFEYYEANGGAVASLNWVNNSPMALGSIQALRTLSGSGSQLDGEEMLSDSSVVSGTGADIVDSQVGLVSESIKISKPVTKPVPTTTSVPSPVPSTVVMELMTENTKRIIQEKAYKEATITSKNLGLKTQETEEIMSMQLLADCNDYSVEYFNNETLAGSPVVEDCVYWPEGEWGSGSPDQLINTNNFSARWTGTEWFEAGKYSFWTYFDDGVKLWIDDQLIVDKWSTPSDISEGAMLSLTEGYHDIKLEYVEKGGDAYVYFWWDEVLSPCENMQNGEFCAEYFNNSELLGNPVSQMKETEINKAWTNNTGPGLLYVINQFSIRWSGQFEVSGGNYRFSAYADDNMRLWVDDELLIDGWDSFAGEQVVEKELSSGVHQLKLEYKEAYGDAIINLTVEELSTLTPPRIYEYDQNGNMVSDNVYCYDYNEANKVSKVRKCATSSLIAEYIYDSNAARVVKRMYTNGVYTESLITVNDLYDVKIKATGEEEITVYYKANNELIAKRNVIQSQSKDEITYHHNDHLGSASIVTDEEGGTIEETRYYPYGEVRDGGKEDKTGRYTYTGQESDSETGLMNYGARYYAAEIGRFVQPDSMLPDIYDVQQLNRYVYVKNNPLKYTDPSGNCATGIMVDTMVCGVGAGASYVVVGGAVVVTIGMTGYVISCIAIGCDETNENINRNATGIINAARGLVSSTGLYINLQVARFNTWRLFESGTDREKLLALTVVALAASGIDPDDIDNGKKQQNNTELNKSKRSLERQLNEHRQKLDKYKNDPYSSDNKSMLNANNTQNHQTIIKNRIKKLEGQIHEFKRQIKEIDTILKSRK